MRALTRFCGIGLGLALIGCSGDSSTGPTSLLLALTPGSVSFVGVQDGNAPGPQTIAITNGGTGPLTGLAVGPIRYGGGSGWLGASLDKTITPATLTLSVTAGGLSSGAYTATLPVSAHGASNSPQQLAVTLLVLGSAGVTTLAAPGQSVAFLDSPNIGTQLTLQADAQYLIAVVNTNPSYTITEDFTLAGALAAGGPATLVASAVAAAPSDQVTRHVPPAQTGGPRFPVSRTGLANPELIRGLAQNHLRVLELNRQVYATFARRGATRTRLQARSARIVPLSGSISQTVGTVNKVYVRNALSSGGCTAVDSIGARTVAVGQHVIVLADTNLTAWPQSQRPDSSFYQSFADEYEQVTWPHTQSYIGDPLAYDSQLSGIGKVTVTITPVVNTRGVAASVDPCDFLPFAASGPEANYSNETEMFYAWTPGPNAFPVELWQKTLRAIAAHETEHIVAFAARILNDSPTLDEIWLEEGLAQESSEIWQRHFNQATWRGHAGFVQTVACELDLGADAPCNAQGDKLINLVLTHLPDFFLYLRNESESNSEGLGKSRESFYGAAWALTRWATDQYAGTEGSFIKSLINEPVLTGLENLSNHTGQPIPLLLVYWNLASAIYDTPAYTAADPRTTIPSFKFAEIFQVSQEELTCGGTRCGLFTFSGLPVYPVQPVALASGAIDRTVTAVPGTAASFFLLSAATSGTQAIQLLSGTGAKLAPSSGLRVGIIRVQ